MLFEESSTDLFLYLEDDLREADAAVGSTGSRYTEYFRKAVTDFEYDGGGNQIEVTEDQDGCEYLLINQYTGELMDADSKVGL